MTEQAELDAMPIEDLEKLVDSESSTGEAPEGSAPEKIVEKTEQATEAKAEVEGKPEVKAKAEFDPEKFQAQLQEQLKRELGTYRKGYSDLQKLPQLIQKQLQEQLQNLQRQSQIEGLTDEQRAQYQAGLTQQQELEKLIEAKADSLLQSKYASEITALQELKSEREEQKKDDKYWGTVLDTAGEDWSTLQPHAEKIWAQVAKELNDTNQEVADRALAKYDRLLSEPSFLVLEANRMQMKEAAGKAADFNGSRATAASKAAQKPSGNSATASSKKAVNEMSQSELDNLSTDELEKALAEAGR